MILIGGHKKRVTIMNRQAAVVFLILAGLAFSAGRAPAADAINAAVSWAGVVADPALEAKKPAGALIGNQKDFAALWKAWNLGGPVPNVDFGAHFVAVVTSSKHTINITRINVGPDGDGFLLSTQLAGEKERDGFGYSIAVFPRAVKRVSKTEIPK